MAQIVWYVLHRRTVTMDIIAGTACAYMCSGSSGSNSNRLVVRCERHGRWNVVRIAGSWIGAISCRC